MQPEKSQCELERARRLCGRLAIFWLSLAVCGCSEITLLQPRGPIGTSELHVILVAFALMLIVVIPVVVMALWFPHRYKADNPRGGYDPAWSESARVDAVIWLIPAVIVLALGTLTWIESHRLDPSVPIPANVTPLEIQVVSLDWKWLFIYPEQGVAAVNELVIPVDIPISFRLTSDSVLTSFFIPQLGSQIYTMAGMQSHLHLLADTPGVYAGQNQQLSGQGFAGMHFKVRAVTPRQFRDWLQQAKKAPEALDAAGFGKLSEPSSDYPVTFYSNVSPGLFETIVNRFRTGHVALRQTSMQGKGY